ncbi:MAG: DMT family transporter [Rubrivivax sp.]|nr:DMT family transporter [Rubrivivax sp.]
MDDAAALAASTPRRRHSHLDTTAVVTLLACCVIWGLGQVAIKLTLVEIPPLLQAGARSAGAALLLLAWMHWRGVRVQFGGGVWRGGLLVGLLFAAEFGCMFYGLQFTTASRMVVFLYTAPFVVALGMPFVARSERLAGWQWAGLVMAFAGVVWAFAEGFTGARGAPRQWLGDALGITAAVLWGATTLALRASAVSRVSAEMALLYQLAVSALLLSLAGAWAGEVWPAAPRWSTWAVLAFQITIITFASYLAWFWLIAHYPATQISVFTLLTPMFGLLAGAWLLGEPLTLRLVVALAAVCGGLWLVSTRGRRPGAR